MAWSTDLCVPISPPIKRRQNLLHAAWEAKSDRRQRQPQTVRQGLRPWHDHDGQQQPRPLHGLFSPSPSVSLLMRDLEFVGLLGSGPGP